MTNDSIRIQSNRGDRPTDSKLLGFRGMDSNRQALWQEPTNESYSDGFVDYTHEL